MLASSRFCKWGLSFSSRQPATAPDTRFYIYAFSYSSLLWGDRKGTGLEIDVDNVRSAGGRCDAVSAIKIKGPPVWISVRGLNAPLVGPGPVIVRN